jgi:DHA1 family bicyclomycin/chloramphenicol resistance-like MFS transporter
VLAVLTETRRETAGIRIRLLAGYGRLARNLRFGGFAMQSAFGSGAFFAHASAATFLMKDLLQRPASEFGLYFMLFPSGFWLGTFLASRLGGKVPVEAMVIAGSAVMVAAALVLSGLMLAGPLVPVALFAPGFFLTLGQGLSLPSSQAGALTSVGQDLTGMASGVGAFLQMFCGGSLAQIVGLAADGTPYPMIVVVTGSAVLALLAALVPATYARIPTATPPLTPS